MTEQATFSPVRGLRLAQGSWGKAAGKGLPPLAHGCRLDSSAPGEVKSMRSLAVVEAHDTHSPWHPSFLRQLPVGINRLPNT